MLHLNGHVRQRAKSPEQRLVVVRPTLVFGCDGHYGAQMAWPKAPQMQVGQSVAVDLDQRAHMLRHGSGIHVEQDGAGIADEAVRPGGDDDGAA